MVFDKEFLDQLLDKASVSERLRQNFDLRNSSADTSQRMLNALQPGTVVPIHRHADTAETVICLCGKLEEIFYKLFRRDGQSKRRGRPYGRIRALKALFSAKLQRRYPTPYFVFMRSSFSSMGREMRKRNDAVDSAWTASMGRPAAIYASSSGSVSDSCASSAEERFIRVPYMTSTDKKPKTHIMPRSARSRRP